MKHLRSVLSQRRTWLALTAVIVLSAPLWAQDTRSPIRRATMFTVKPDRVGEFEADVKQYNEAYAKISGARSNGVFQSMTGPYQYIRTFNYDKWSDLERGPVGKAISENAELARIALRINGCIENSTTLVEELLPELSTGLPAEAPKMMVVSRTRILAGKSKEYEEIIKNELLPAYKKAGRTLTFRRVVFGAPIGEYISSTRVSGWEEAGAVFLRASMGAEAYDRMVAKLTPLTVERERNVFRFREDLSYRAPAGSAAPTTTSSR